ncbi:MAG: hypothetical protein J6J36_06645 [Clostridia bacterium]|nr:hypothetical protein [Clostridia bacterium]
MSRRNNLGLAEVVAEKMEDLNLLGEYTMYEFLGKTLIAFEQGDTSFINSEILEPLYNIDDKTDFEREIIYDVEERLPMSEEQQVIWELVQKLSLNQNPLLFLNDKIEVIEKLLKVVTEKEEYLTLGYHNDLRSIRFLLEGIFDFINNHSEVEFIGKNYIVK